MVGMNEVACILGGEAPYLMSMRCQSRGDVVMFDEVINVFSPYHECSLPKDKVYGFRELVPQWQGNLVVN